MEHTAKMLVEDVFVLSFPQKPMLFVGIIENHDNFIMSSEWSLQVNGDVYKNNLILIENIPRIVDIDVKSRSLRVLELLSGGIEKKEINPHKDIVELYKI